MIPCRDGCPGGLCRDEIPGPQGQVRGSRLYFGFSNGGGCNLFDTRDVGLMIYDPVRRTNFYCIAPESLL